MDRNRVQDALGGSVALLALGQRLVAHPLDHIEDVAVGAFVLVDRHTAADYRSRPRGGGQEESLPLLPRRARTAASLYGSAVATAPETRPDQASMEEIVALCKRRGFVFPSSEIYGGLGSTYDYGHYGVLLKNNVKAEWWRAMLQERDDIVALDSAILQHPRVWEASGHLEGFTDPLVQCLGKCKKRWREDHLREAVAEAGGDPAGGAALPGVRRRAVGAAPVQPDVRDPHRPGGRRGLGGLPAAGDGAGHLHQLQERARLRPQEAARSGSPRSASPSATRSRPGNFIFRTREFEQMEMEFFVPPAEAARVARAWIEERERWYTELGIRPDLLRVRPHGAEELSHYSSATSDIEYLFPIGWSELEGIANRGDFDLTQHAEFSGEKLEYFDQETKERYVPYVIEPAAGADRAALAFLVDAYDVEEVEGRKRTVLRLHPRLAPVKVAVLPLVSKEGMPEKAREIFEELRRRIPAEFDEGGSIGKRYRRQDEIGTPWGITVDGQTMEDDTVTLRDRDSLEQVRVPIEGLADDLAARLAQPWRSPKLG